MLKVIAPDRAGEEGWSVAVTVDACARAQMREGRAAPVLMVSFMIEDDRCSCIVRKDVVTHQRLAQAHSHP